MARLTLAEPARTLWRQVRDTIRTALTDPADDFVRAFGEAFDDYLGDWAEAIRRHIVEGVSLTATTRPRQMT